MGRPLTDAVARAPGYSALLAAIWTLPPGGADIKRIKEFAPSSALAEYLDWSERYNAKWLPEIIVEVTPICPGRATAVHPTGVGQEAA